MEVTLLWQTLNLLVTDPAFIMSLLVFGVGVVMVLSIFEAWRFVKEMRGL